MKTLLTTFFLAILITQAAFTQTPVKPASTEPFQSSRTSGIKGGLNLASLSGYGNYLGFHGGFFGEVQSNRSFGYSGEALFSKQGGGSVALSYLSLPVMANLYAGNFTFQGGGYGALLLMADHKSTNGYSDVSGSLKGIDFGALIGIRLKLDRKIGIGARFYQGIQNIAPGILNLRNRNFQFDLNHSF